MTKVQLKIPPVKWITASARLPHLIIKAVRYSRKYGRKATATLFAERFAFWSHIPHKKTSPEHIRCVTLRGYDHPMYFRTCTSDIFVIDQVFGEEVYWPVKKFLKSPTIIIDCGANIGCTAVYLLHLFTTAKLVAIEPDHDNYEILSMNLRPYADRAIAIHAAVWGKNCSVYADPSDFRDCLHWCRRFSEVPNEGPSQCCGITIDELLNRLGINRVDFLKMDIEGAEAVVFSHPPIRWLENVACLAVELHDTEAEEKFRAAIADIKGEVYRHGETTWWLNRSSGLI